MVKTQIQLPEELYRRVKQFAAQREWSLAETIRRSIEEMFERYPVAAASSEWQPPTPRSLGCRPIPLENLKRFAQDDEPQV